MAVVLPSATPDGEEVGLVDGIVVGGVGLEVSELEGGRRFRRMGAGKEAFLSIASTVRWKRRKRASARMRVDSRSIVVDSSFTYLC